MTTAHHGAQAAHIHSSDGLSPYRMRDHVEAPNFAAQVRAGVEAARRTADLDTLARGLWGGLAAGMLAEDEAAALSDALEAKRQILRTPIGEGAINRLAVNAPRRPTLFARAKAQTPPDRRRSMERRRRLAASGPMPPMLASYFTTGELAVLRIVGDEVRKHGVCSRTVAELAARAGVSESTAKNAIRAAVAAELLHKRERPRPGRKHLANLLTITSKAWRAWIDRRPPTPWEPTGVKSLPSTSMPRSKRLFEMSGGEVAKGASSSDARPRSSGRRSPPALAADT